MLVTHQRELIRSEVSDVAVVVYAHTHKPRIDRDDAGRLWINPGETSGWTYDRPSIAVLDTTSLQAELIWLREPVAAGDSDQ